MSAVRPIGWTRFIVWHVVPLKGKGERPTTACGIYIGALRLLSTAPGSPVCRRCDAALAKRGVAW